MYPTSTTENISPLTFCMGKRDSTVFEDFSCVNRFEFHGNKPLELLMDPFESTIWFKTVKII